LGSKAEAERVARRYQQAGAPVVITYPGSVFGPHDPHWATGCGGCARSSRATTGSPLGRLSDRGLRDVAAVHAAVLEPARGPRRYLAGGTFLRFADLVARLGAVTGRRLRAPTVPAGMLLPAGRAVQLVQRVVPVHIPVEFEGIYFLRCAARSGESRTRTELGVAPRDLQVTLVDSVQWLFQQGHISVGKPANSPPSEVARPLTTCVQGVLTEAWG
jgi:dihydroflavonol-4-reductase